MVVLGGQLTITDTSFVTQQKTAIHANGRFLSFNEPRRHQGVRGCGTVIPNDQPLCPADTAIVSPSLTSPDNNSSANGSCKPFGSLVLRGVRQTGSYPSSASHVFAASSKASAFAIHQAFCKTRNWILTIPSISARPRRSKMMVS